MMFVILLIAFVRHRMRLNAYVKNLPKIPQSAFLPLLWVNKTSAELFYHFEKITSYCDGLTSGLFGTKLVIFCDDPVNMQTILTSKQCVNKPDQYRMVTAASRGVFAAKGICTHSKNVFDLKHSDDRKGSFFFYSS